MAYMVPGILQEPCFSEQRLDLTKPISLVYIIDDIFDVYGELDELTIFTQVVESGLICSERSWSKQNGLIRVTYQILRSNGFVSSGVHLVMLHVYYLLGEEITTGKVELIESIPKIVSSAATILRLWDDLGSAKGDWNGAGAHCNYSTKTMRNDGGLAVIKKAIEKLQVKHKEHIAAYGEGNERRLTGKHETADINTFSWGVANRGASVRVGRDTEKEGKGYFEDRRPASNMDPYVVTSMIAETTILG